MDIKDKKDIIYYLGVSEEEKIRELFDYAYKVKVENVGKFVYFRGIIEFSNICTKNCYYCGIRKDNTKIKRFSMTEDEIIELALWAYENNYGSIVLQSGERKDKDFVLFIEKILKKIKKLSNDKLGITLSVGEQDYDTYKRWFDAGAHRYLLRIEASDRELYEKLHPADHSYDVRLKCLESLRDIGYQVGTGVMIGLPFQTLENLANDILFFKKMDIDMIGMGPYIIHEDTPIIKYVDSFDKESQLNLALKMIAVTRIFLKDVNIASTTALQALKHIGRELGLMAGANIIMPTITDTKYRQLYLLYQDKPCIDENAGLCRNCLQARIESIGEKIGFNEWGDSPHYFKKVRES